VKGLVKLSADSALRAETSNKEELSPSRCPLCRSELVFLDYLDNHCWQGIEIRLFGQGKRRDFDFGRVPCLFHFGHSSSNPKATMSLNHTRCNLVSSVTRQLRPRPASWTRNTSTSAHFDTSLSRTPHFAMKQMKYALQNSGSDSMPKIIPAWVADTDFASPPAVRERLSRYISEHGVLGYSEPSHMTPLTDVILRWCRERYGWTVEKNWIVHLPGVVPGFNVGLRALKHPARKEKCLVQVPNYPPMLSAPGLNDFEMSGVRTIKDGKRWTLDLEQLEKLAKDPETTVFLACNPANPTGTVLSRTEMDAIAAICQQNGVTIVSDEIWADLVLEGQHIPAGSIPALQNTSITIMAPSKTFNVAGLCSAFAIIPNPALRKQFKKAKAGLVPSPGILGSLAAAEAFSGSCDDWLAEQIEYLKGNRDLFCAGVERELSGLVDIVKPDATFLLWLDCCNLSSSLSLKSGVQKWFEDAGIGPSPGADFGGTEFKDFARINFGAPRKAVEQMLARLIRAVKSAVA